MPRLIDADKLENDIVENITVKAVSRMLAIIQGQPIVKAIPIEWIWKWYDEETHRLGDGWTHVEHPYSMERMIEDWEKENEESSNRD